MEYSPHIPPVRHFNRYYTQRIGALNDRYMDGPYSLAELRILHELFKSDGITATQLATQLSMDHGFLSRKLSGLVQKRLIKRTRSSIDKRQYAIALSVLGRKQQPKLEAQANTHVARMLEPVAPEKRDALVRHMQAIEKIMQQKSGSIIFRQLGLGDAGWIVYRHGAVMAKEFGWNQAFEGFCAQIMADFIRNYQPQWERSWIVERDGEILGSIFLIRENETTARLRLLYVEPAARGLGLATKLLEKSIQFARSKGYKKVTLFTTASNVAARRIYVKLGMALTQEEPFELAGQMHAGEHWDLAL